MKALNNKGFTLVEIMIAGAILSLLALGFTTYLFNINKHQRQVEVKNNMTDVRMQAQAAAIDPEAIMNSINY